MVKKLYVGNLSWSSTEDGLRNVFAQHGTVHSVKIITDRETGRSRGFGFVEMENAEAAAQALNGADVDGRKIRVDEAQERKPKGGRRDDGGNY